MAEAMGAMLIRNRETTTLPMLCVERSHVSGLAPLHRVVFLNDTLTWGDVVPDTLWTEGQTGLVLNASGSSALLNADALLPNLDTSWSSEFVLPFIGGPIPIAPGAEIWSEVEAVNLSVPDVDLRRIRIGSGALILTASSTVPFATGPSGGPDFLYFDNSDVTASSLDDLGEH